ncbi:MAG: hypothetical protein E7485_06420 [Ruminococcaceae bacterium]|nr:hypothetical protein [Oscillospiraceae bacterium]
MNFIDYCNHVDKIEAHLTYAYCRNLLNEDGYRTRQGYQHISETLDFCDSFEELKNTINLEQFIKDYGDLAEFKPLIRKLNELT